MSRYHYGNFFIFGPGISVNLYKILFLSFVLNIYNFLFTRYRTLTLCKVFFEQTKWQTQRITNVDTGDSTDVSCIYPHVGPIGIHI